MFRSVPNRAVLDWLLGRLGPPPHPRRYFSRIWDQRARPAAAADARDRAVVGHDGGGCHRETSASSHLAGQELGWTSPHPDVPLYHGANQPWPRAGGYLMESAQPQPCAAEAGRAMPASTDSSAFRHAMRSLPTGVTVVTVASEDGNMHGMTVNSFSSVSLDPMLVLVCLNERSPALGLIERAGAFAVNVLSADQKDVSRWFASRHRPPGSMMFDGVPFERGITGCPVLLDAASSFDCRLRQTHRAGDHLILLGEVVALLHRPHREPLIFHAGTYKSLRHDPLSADRVAA